MRSSRWLIGAVGALVVCACGGSSEDNLFQATGGAAGKGGGASGKGGTTAAGSGGSTTAGKGGSTTAGTGGATGGSAGATGGTAGATGGSTTGGTAGTTSGGQAGTAGKGGAAGAAGAAACAAGCDDGIPCTIDSCVMGACVHVPGMCPVGQNCDIKDGCIQAPTCSADDTCKAMWGADACKTNIRCDGATATCKFDILDKDGDLHWPIVCGGDDCDDVDPNKHPGRPEICDGKDNDCDGTIDDNAPCAAPRVCSAGACSCPPSNQCGAECVDKATNPNNCGGCGIKCPAGSVCTNGLCDCPGTQTACGATCVDTQSSTQHCGGCNKPCGALQACVGGKCECAKKQCGVACVDTGIDEQNCGDCGIKCATGATCVTGACTCPAAAPKTCGGACVDTDTDPKNCGDCGIDCSPGACKAGVCSTCSPAGMLILLDQSGSMTTTLASGGTRYSHMVDGVKAFIQDPVSAGVSVGVTFYPRGAFTSSCVALDYAVPDAAIAPLPGNAPALLTAIGMGTANGASVLAAPLTAAIDNVRTWIGANAGHPGVVVIINDGGAGNTCTGEVPVAVSAAMAGTTGTPSVPTYLIGVGVPSATELQSWNDVAAAGGTVPTATANVGATAIADALRAIRAKYACP